MTKTFTHNCLCQKFLPFKCVLFLFIDYKLFIEFSIGYFPLNSIRSNDSQMTDASDCDDKPVRLYYLLGENLLIFPCVLFGTYLFVNFHI